MSAAGEPAWPRMGEAAFVAILGGFVETWAPHTEADPVGLLGAALCVAGCYLGNRSYFTIKPDRHPARHNVTLVGTTAKGRKSSALSCGEDLAKRTDPDWYAARRRSGFGSGEALIDALAPSEIEPAPDPRLLLVQHELAASWPPLGAMDRRCRRSSATFTTEAPSIPLPAPMGASTPKTITPASCRLSRRRSCAAS